MRAILTVIWLAACIVLMVAARNQYQFNQRVLNALSAHERRLQQLEGVTP